MIHAISLALIIAATCSSIFFLPPVSQTSSALNIEIPSYFGSWRNHTFPPSEKELKTLASDTKFARAICELPRVEDSPILINSAPNDQVDFSIVLSGYDLANSIHRPERCMPAQGFKILNSKKEGITLKDGKKIPLTRLISKRDVVVRDKDGSPKHLELDYLTYYFFVGHNKITADHTKRTLIDIVDRVTKGEAQQWAFVMCSIPYKMDDDKEFGNALLTIDRADKKVRELLEIVLTRNVDWDSIKY